VMKAGLMEIADVFVVNKADRPGADKIRQELEVAIGLRAGQAFRHVAAKAGHGAAGRKSGTAVSDGAVGRKSGTAVKDEDAVPLYRSTALPPWEPPVMPTIASQGDGVPELVAMLDQHFAQAESSGALEQRRAKRLVLRTREVVDRAMKRWLWTSQKDEMDAMLRDVESGGTSPYEAAAALVARLQGSVAYERS
jgi:LAO/AO transport system kinase